MKKLIAPLVVLLLAVVFLAKPVSRWWQARRFEGSLKTYERLAYPASSDGVLDGTLPYDGGKIGVEAGKMPYRSGKVFVVQQSKDRSKGGPIFAEDEVPHIDPVWYELDGSLRAGSPDECATLIQTYHDLQDRTGYVGGGGFDPGLPSGMRRPELNIQAVLGTKTVRLRVLDMKRKVLVGTWTILGPKPPETLKREEIASLPGAPLLEFIRAMPAR